MFSVSPIGGVLLAIAASLILVQRRRRKAGLPYPPGPKGYPLIGNVLDIFQDLPLWKVLMSMAEKHNPDVLYVNLLGADHIVLNSEEAISDLSDKRSGIYSGRPHIPMLELMDAYSWSLPMAEYGDRWRSSRRLLHEFLNIRAVKDFDDMQYHYSRDFALRLSESPEDLWGQMKFSSSALIMSMTYGFDIKSHDDPFLAAAERALATIEEAAVPGAFLVDTLPILRYVPSWFPGARFKHFARNARKDFGIAVDGPLDHIKESLKSGSARNASIASTCLDRLDDLSSQGFTEDNIRMATSSMYIAAVDTSIAISQVFFMLMAIHPDIQKKAQKEIDQLLGGERLPTLSDQDDLPYISALIKELYRWHTPLPISIPKMLKEDDVYKGYHLPKGATIIENIWAVFQDPKVYPKPHVYNPERFLKDGKLDKSVRDPEDRVFGSSRRICPGRHFASSSVFLRVATTLATFDIEPGVNEKGEVESEIKFHEGIVRHPIIFKCLVKPRSESALNLVRDAHTAGSR